MNTSPMTEESVIIQNANIVKGRQSNMKRIAVLVNKDFEYAGFIEGLRDTVPVYAGTNGRDAECRFDSLIADIYCIQNLFKDGENSSNSELKYGYLKNLFKRQDFRLDECDGILSFSTSESTPESESRNTICSENGCVYIGNKFFLSDQSINDKKTISHLAIGSESSEHTEWYVSKQLCDGLYRKTINTGMTFKIPFNFPATNVMCRANEDFTCVGVVNVMNYERYKTADREALNQFHYMAKETFGTTVGIETTHGVVVKALKSVCSEMPMTKDIPINFISPIVDRYLHFDDDVDGKYGKQNFICSYNGGVVTGHMLKILSENM